MRILSQVLKDIEDTFLSAPIESGGIIGSRQGIVCAFYFDKGNYNPESYTPSISKLNAKISERAGQGIMFCGVIHSHHNDCRLFSDTDKEYALTVRKSVGDIPLFPHCNALQRRSRVNCLLGVKYSTQKRKYNGRIALIYFFLKSFILVTMGRIFTSM